MNHNESRMSGWYDEWVSGITHTWISHEWVDDIMNESRMSQWHDEWVSDRMNESVISTDGGDQTNNYDCQNFQQVFTGVPAHIKQVPTGVPKILNQF